MLPPNLLSLTQNYFECPKIFFFFKSFGVFSKEISEKKVWGQKSKFGTEKSNFVGSKKYMRF